MSSLKLSTNYHFKDIVVLPTANDLIDIVLSKTQRKTPTEIHKQFKISRIRNFYLKKIKFAQQTFHDKLASIISQFPRLDDIHPFYGDLCNVLYDKDHYKIALSKCSLTKNIIDKIAKDYVRLMKYSDSLYKCKMLKKAALGRMCTAVKKLKDTFQYLEEVRQHLSRLPSINPATRTLIVCGYPNVGKSSFVNKVSNANVEVQPYAFTTKSLYVGHFDFAYSRFQIIDTPGILDRPLESRNTIEMTAITALAHIHSAILYFFDLSEQCGFSLKEQVHLFNSIKALFNNKCVVLVFNKIDLMPFESLDDNNKELMTNLINESNFKVVHCSTVNSQGVDEAKDIACMMLIESRILKKSLNLKIDNVVNRLYVTKPKSNSLNERPPHIPLSVLHSNGNDNHISSYQNEKVLQDIYGGPGVYSVDLAKNYILTKDEWKYDIRPEIYNGKNICDFVDPEIQQKVTYLIEEESEILNRNDVQDFRQNKEYQDSVLSLRKLHAKINHQRLLNSLKKSKNSRILSRNVKKTKLNEIEEKMKSVGLSVPKNISFLRRKKELKNKSRVESCKLNLNNSVSVELVPKKGKDEMDIDEEFSPDDKNNNNLKFGQRALKLARKRLKSLGYDFVPANDEEDESGKIRKKVGFFTPRKRRQSLSLSKRLIQKRSSKVITKCDTLPVIPQNDMKNDGTDQVKESGNISVSDIMSKLKTEKLRRIQLSRRNSKHLVGYQGNRKPLHLFTGKRGLGKAQRR